MLSVLEAYHSSPVGGRHSGIRIAHKILQCGYYWPTLHQDAHELLKHVTDANEMAAFQESKSSLKPHSCD